MKMAAAALAFLIGLGLPALGQTKFAPMRYMNLPQLRPWTGDFDGMLKRRVSSRRWLELGWRSLRVARRK
jgi:hypothetical protein